MANVITIDNVEYVGYEENEPESYILDLNNKYIKILEEDYCHIQKGSYLVYRVDDEKVKGGILLKFIEPSIFVFKNETDMYIWSINIEDSEVYIKDKKLIKRERQLKEQLFQLYNEGYIKILDEPMIQNNL